MQGSSQKWLLGCLIALLPALGMATTTRTVIFQQAYAGNEPHSISNEYITIWNDGPVDDENLAAPPALIGEPLFRTVDGKTVGTVHLRSTSVDDNSMCGNTQRLRLVEPLAPGKQLFSTVDLNPGQRFTPRKASADERRALLQLISTNSGLTRADDVASQKPTAKELAAATSSFSNPGTRHEDDDSRLSISIIEDGQQTRHRLALIELRHVVQATADGDQRYPVTSVMAIYEFTAGQWHARAGIASHGCMDCEDTASTYHVGSWGDIDGDGAPDVLLELSGYESNSYMLMLSRNNWQPQQIAGGC